MRFEIFAPHSYELSSDSPASKRNTAGLVMIPHMRSLPQIEQLQRLLPWLRSRSASNRTLPQWQPPPIVCCAIDVLPAGVPSPLNPWTALPDREAAISREHDRLRARV